MYFDFLPAIKYDLKPISYPFSESDYVVAKNFFRRYKISDTAFGSAVYYKKYAIGDLIRLEQIAEVAYGSPYYDWVIALVNNMMNPLYDLPMSESELRVHIESSYDNPYYDIHHYEIINDEEQKNKFGKVLLPGGTVVDQSFYDNRRVLTADVFPDLSPTTSTVTFTTEYIFSDAGFDNSFVNASDGANFEGYGSGLGDDGGFVFNAPLRNSVRSQGYLRFRGNAFSPRSATFAPIDTTYVTTFTINAKYGSNDNGGEIPDQGDEILLLQYRTDPSDSWTTINTIIPKGVIQYFQFDGTPLLPTGFGGIGRPQGVYTDVIIYDLSGNPTPARATVTVNASNYITSIELTDRGVDIPIGTADLTIKNEDIGNGYWLDSEGVPQYFPDVNLFNVDTGSTPDGTQYSRYGTVPFRYSLDLPAGARSPNTELRLYQPDNTGTAFDQYGIQSVETFTTRVLVIDTEINYTRIDDDNYVIDGVQWTRDNGTWYRVTEIGYRYYDNGLTKEISGSELSRPVTEFEYESNENEKKREIYILKPLYLDRLVEDFRKASLYKKSSDFVSNRLKKTGV